MGYDYIVSVTKDSIRYEYPQRIIRGSEKILRLGKIYAEKITKMKSNH